MIETNAWADPEGVTGGLNPPRNSQVAKGFLRNSDSDTPREGIEPFGSNSFPREVHKTLCEIR